MADNPFGATVSDLFGTNSAGNLISAPIISDSAGILRGNPILDSALTSALPSLRSKSNGSEAEERLFLARPRSTTNDISDRGPHAYIKLMTSSQQAANYASGSVNDNGLQCTAESTTLSESLTVMSSGGADAGYDKFIVTGVAAQMDEKLQIMEVFGDNEVAYYFGRAPMLFTISGVLIDSPDNSWFTDWIYTYDGSMRGTQLARNRELLQLVLPSMTLTGSITRCGWDQQSATDVAIPFQFQFLVKSLTPTPAMPIGSAITNAAQSINFDSEQSFTTWSQINDLRTQGASLAGLIQDPMSSIGQIGSAMMGLGNGVGASLGIRGTSSFVSDFIDGITNTIAGAESGIGRMFSPIISFLNGMRASIFAPIYGVMNSLARLVKTIFGGGGLGSLLNALTAPIRGFLGDITRVFTQASAIVGMINSGLASIGRGTTSGFGLRQSYQTAIRAFENCAGTITSLPLNVSNNIRNLVNGGHISSDAAFLRYDPKHSLSRGASLGSGSGSGSGGGAVLGNGAAKVSPQMAILSSGHRSTSTAGAYV